MRADHGALVTLDTVFHNPFRHIDGHSPLLVLGGVHRKNAVRLKSTDRKLITLLGQNGAHYIFNKIRLVLFSRGFAGGFRPGFRIFDFHQIVQRLVHRGKVHIHNLLALFREQLFDLVFQISDGVINRNHVGQLKKGRLHDHVDATAQPHFTGNFFSIDIVKFELFLSDGAAHVSRKLFFHLLGRPVRIEDKCSAVFDTFEHIVNIHIIGFVAGDIVGGVNQVGGLNRVVAEPQMGNGHPA